jgi:nucleotide-binding universal stress UspA family protein
MVSSASGAYPLAMAPDVDFAHALGASSRCTGWPAQGRKHQSGGTPDAPLHSVQIRRILVPVDFSALADVAFEYALGLAQRLDAKLLLLHVFQVPAFAYPDASVPLPAETLLEAEHMARSSLDKLLKRAEAASVPASPLLLEGAAFVEIIRAARSEGADLIVMSTHGRTGLRHALLGSVAEKVVRKAPCPVLVVRSPGATFEPP